MRSRLISKTNNFLFIFFHIPILQSPFKISMQPSALNTPPSSHSYLPLFPTLFSFRNSSTIFFPLQFCAGAQLRNLILCRH